MLIENSKKQKKVRPVKSKQKAKTEKPTPEELASQKWDEERPQRESINKEAAAVLNRFLDTRMRHNKRSIAWHLHVLCRVGDGEEYGMDYDEIGLFKGFIESLIKTFMHSEVSKIYHKEQGEFDYDLPDRLMRLHDFFDSLEKPDTEAELTKMDCDGTMSIKDAERVIWRFNRLQKAQKAHDAAFWG